MAIEIKGWPVCACVWSRLSASFSRKIGRLCKNHSADSVRVSSVKYTFHQTRWWAQGEGTLTTISRIKYYYARRTKNAKLAPRRPYPSSWGRSTATLWWRWRLLPFCCTPSRLDRVSTPNPLSSL